MRKLLICLGLIVFIVLCYFFFAKGFQAISVNSYQEIVDADKTLRTKKVELNKLNKTDYENKIGNLDKAVDKYKDAKEKYEALIPSFANSEVTLSVKPYDVEFLWTIIGNYATEEGIGINLDFVSSISNTANKSADEYIIADMNFTVAGTYNSIIEFLYDLEDDDRLGFEIRNFKMAKGGNGVQSTFSVQGIPITNYNLSSLNGGTQVTSRTNTNGLTDEGTNPETGTNPATSNAINNATTNTATNTATNTTTSNTAPSTNTTNVSSGSKGNSARNLNY